MRVIGVCVAALFLVGGGCARDATVPVARGGGPPVAEAPGPSETKTKMMSHFVTTDTMLDALLTGDLDSFRAAAGLVAVDGEHGPPFSRSTAVRDAANAARAAETLVDAAAGLAAIGVACGDCHRTSGGPTQSFGAPPTARMARHRWAGARMWQGLVEPADDAWFAGSNAFAEAPLMFDTIPSNAPKDKQVAAFTLSARAHAIAKQASLATTTAERQRLLAALYATCAGCHSIATTK